MSSLTRFFFLFLLPVPGVFSPAWASDEHRPVYSPDGKTIAYMSKSEATADDWELFVMRADGGEPVRLTHHEGWDGYAVWSPDGSMLIFDREDDGNKQPVRLNVVSGESRVLGQHDGWMAINDWSEDGNTLLAFHEVEKQRDLYLLDRNTKLVRQLTNTPDSNEHDAHFSPEGNLIAYANESTDGSALEVMDLETGDVVAVVRSKGRIYGIDWSPDGGVIAYTDNPSGGEDDDADVFLVEIATRETRRLTENDAWDHMPEFHPDGRSLLFTSYRSGSEHIYRYDLKTSDISLLEPQTVK